MEPEQLKGHLDGLVLAVIAGEPKHGYAVIQALKVRSQGRLDLPEGTVYPALHGVALRPLSRNPASRPTRCMNGLVAVKDQLSRS
jgi:hypothetical protein